ncbi:MAG: HGGxSTG domain-containing protein [Lysobacter sp.]
MCGAKRRSDGEPCQGSPVPGKKRCKWHGGCSTGPKTDSGRASSLANLRQYQLRVEE